MEAQFRNLYENYHQDLFQFLFYLVKNKEQAEDLVQDVYVKALQAYDRFEGKSSEKTWLLSIARHTAYDWFRKQKRSRQNWTGLFDWKEQTLDVADTSLLPEEIAMQNEEIQMMYRALKQCTINQQMVLVLRYIQSYSIVETADILGWSESKVKTTQHRGMKALKSLMEEEDEGREGSEYDRVKVE